MTFDWSQIEKYYDQGTTAGYMASILASERLLRQVLKEKNYPGRNWEEKIQLAKIHLSAPQTLEQSRALTKQILALNLPNAITQSTVEQILKSYFAAITELADLESLAIGKSRISYHLRRWRMAMGRLILGLFIGAIIVVGGAWFFTKTQSGQNLGSRLAVWSDFVIYKALPVFLIAIAAVAALTAFAVRNNNESRD